MYSLSIPYLLIMSGTKSSSKSNIDEKMAKSVVVYRAGMRSVTGQGSRPQNCINDVIGSFAIMP